MQIVGHSGNQNENLVKNSDSANTIGTIFGPFISILSPKNIFVQDMKNASFFRLTVYIFYIFLRCRVQRNLWTPSVVSRDQHSPLLHHLTECLSLLPVPLRFLYFHPFDFLHSLYHILWTLTPVCLPFRQVLKNTKNACN